MPSAVTAKSEGPPSGTLLIIGGTITPVIRAKALELGGPRWVVIPTAEANPQEQNVGLQELDLRAGQYTVRHTRDRSQADTEEFVAPLKTATAVWFTGGRQYRLVDAYKGTLVEKELRAVLDRGGLIAGSSAGATIQGSFLFRGAPSEDNRILIHPDYQEAFGYITNCAIDQHVGQRQRDYDLACVVGRYPNLLGIGIDEDAAVIVRKNTMTVIGENRVLITDGRFHNERPFYALHNGDCYDLAAWQKL
jgi:cyanophycinase